MAVFLLLTAVAAAEQPIKPEQLARRAMSGGPVGTSASATILRQIRIHLEEMGRARADQRIRHLMAVLRYPCPNIDRSPPPDRWLEVVASTCRTPLPTNTEAADILKGASCSALSVASSAVVRRFQARFVAFFVVVQQNAGTDLKNRCLLGNQLLQLMQATAVTVTPTAPNTAPSSQLALTVLVTPKGLAVKGNWRTRQEDCQLSDSFWPRQQGRYPIAALHRYLLKVKGCYPAEDTVVIKAHRATVFRDVVRVMEAARERCLTKDSSNRCLNSQPLFPKVVFSVEG